MIQTQSVMAKIYVNGDAQEVSLPLNVSELISQSNVQQPEMVSVQVNEEFAEREDWEQIQLKENDKVDFLYFMGGGNLK
jgi:sulfur carrier protein